MNGRAAKAARKTDRMREAVIQAHDRLHKDDVEGCHNLLHQALGSGEIQSDVAPLSGSAEFDAGFRRLCARYGVRASYVLAQPVTEGRTRLISGGDAELDAVVTQAVRAAS